MNETAETVGLEAPRPTGTRPWRVMLVALVLAIAMAVALSMAGTASASTTPGVYWGATIGTQFTGSSAPWDMDSATNSVTDFAKQDAGGKGPSLISWGSSFYSTPYCAGDCTFQKTASQ